MTEDSLVRRIARRAASITGRGLVLGIGDDCAIFRPRGSPTDLVITTDMVLEDVHFRRQTHTPESVGHKALARGLSDIAAMGAEPLFCLVSLAVGRWADPAWVDGFYGGLLRLARASGTALAGGDLARARLAACDIVVAGSVPRGRALRRDGAAPGDRIYVSGALGGSALGLATGKGPAWRRHLAPQPRLALGRFLRQSLRASAAMDISDGLSLDLRRLCRASGLSAEIQAPPAFPGATLEQALHGGEDYELLFTAGRRTRVPAAFEGLPLNEIGVMQAGPAGRITLDGKRLQPLGYDHFRRD